MLSANSLRHKELKPAKQDKSDNGISGGKAPQNYEHQLALFDCGTRRRFGLRPKRLRKNSIAVEIS